MESRLLTISYHYGNQTGRIFAVSAAPVVLDDPPAVPNGTKCLDLVGAIDEGANKSILTLSRIILPIVYVTYVGYGDEFLEIGKHSDAMIVVKPDAPTSPNVMDE